MSTPTYRDSVPVYSIGLCRCPIYGQRRTSGITSGKRT